MGLTSAKAAYKNKGTLLLISYADCVCMEYKKDNFQFVFTVHPGNLQLTENVHGNKHT